MERFIVLSFFICLLCTFSIATSNGSPKKTYIIQMDKSAKPEVFTGGHGQWYSSLVKSVLCQEQETGEGSGDEMVLYSYQTAFHGVAARLTEEELQRLEKKHGVLAVFPETVYRLHTTRSSLFMKLLGNGNGKASSDPWAGKLLNSNVVVGVLDTGIWPESPSFNDTGMGPVPRHWKGECEVGRGFGKSSCNRKIVGARVFYQGYEAASGKIPEQAEYKSPRDQDGHGTHTASTVAGSPVRGANLFGYAYGTARGMATAARVAAYKVCWTGGCFSSDILSAVDRAVADGVNILSISLGGGVSSYGRDSLSVATFGAMEMGVFVSCSAGNSGPAPITLTNVSPWIATVGASTMDREFPATIKLGSRQTFTGASLYKGKKNLSVNKQYPLIYFGGNSSTPAPRSLCLEGALDRRSVAGKIVICDRGVSARAQKGLVVKNAGGLGMILCNTAANGEELVADSHLLPAAGVGETAGIAIKNYASSTQNPTATLSFLGTKTGVKPSPVVAAFSSRGPNILTLEIVKPDFVAPGVNILAGWTGDLGPSTLPTDLRRTKFNILSGTSMSCPHVSGVAALIKAKHPDWSPAAIKSALMTTAYVHDNTFKNLKDASTAKESTAYDHGAGHINPTKAVDPGLIYDITPQDYFDFLCTQDLEPDQLRQFGKFSNRSCKHTISNPGDLNYPAISVLFPEDSKVLAVSVRRTVTNVGPPVSSYHLAVSEFRGATVKVEPDTLRFTQKQQKLSFKVTFTRKDAQAGPEFGSLVWKDGTHKVRSPIVVTWLTPM